MVFSKLINNNDIDLNIKRVAAAILLDTTMLSGEFLSAKALNCLRLTNISADLCLRLFTEARGPRKKIIVD